MVLEQTAGSHCITKGTVPPMNLHPLALVGGLNISWCFNELIKYRLSSTGGTELVPQPRAADEKPTAQFPQTLWAVYGTLVVWRNILYVNEYSCSGLGGQKV